MVNRFQVALLSYTPLAALHLRHFDDVRGVFQNRRLVVGAHSSCDRASSLADLSNITFEHFYVLRCVRFELVFVTTRRGRNGVRLITQWYTRKVQEAREVRFKVCLRIVANYIYRLATAILSQLSHSLPIDRDYNQVWRQGNAHIGAASEEFPPALPHSGNNRL